MDKPGTFNFNKFWSFCNEYTDGMSPINRVDYTTEEGKKFVEVLQSSYQVEYDNLGDVQDKPINKMKWKSFVKGQLAQFKTEE